MRKILFLFILLLIKGGVYAADEISFTASSPEAVVVGQEFRIMYTVTTQKVKDFRTPAFDGFEVLMGPSESHRISNINGNITSSITYTFILLPLKEGTITIPEATIIADGKLKKSNELKIRVLPPDQGSGASSGQNKGAGQRASTFSSNGQVSDKDLFITATLNKMNVFEQEALLLTYKVYYLVNLQQLEIKMPDLNGFHSQEVKVKREHPTLEHYNGRNYNSLIWSQYVLYPQQSGKLEIPSIDFDATIAVRTQQSLDPFEAFFNGGATYVEIRKTISTPKLTLNVNPLPSGEPDSFSGAVGDFSLRSSLSAKELKTNEALTIKLEIDGVGNMKLIDAPEVDFPQDFEIYDPKIENQFVLTKNGLSGKKVIEYLAIPRHAGNFTIPSIKFAYFDVKTKQYKELQTESYELHVEKGKGSSDVAVSSYTNKEEVKLLGQDIHYIKTGETNLRLQGNFLFGTLIYWMWYIGPFIILTLIVILLRKKALENANTAKVRGKNANKVAVKRLKVAANLLKEDKKEEFYDEVLKALWGYTSDKLNMSISNLSKENVSVEFEKQGVNRDVIDAFLKVLNDCEYARYAPGDSNKTMDNVYSLAIEIISKLENIKKH